MIPLHASAPVEELRIEPQPLRAMILVTTPEGLPIRRYESEITVVQPRFHCTMTMPPEPK